MQRLYVEQSVIPHPVRGVTTGLQPPALAGILGTELDLGVYFMRIGATEAIAVGTTGGKLTMIKKDDYGGEALVLDAAWEVVGTGAAAYYRFTGILDNADLRAAIGVEKEITLICNVEWLLSGAAAVSKTEDFEFVLKNSASRPEQVAPAANTDESWAWIKARAPEANGFTHDDEAKELSVPEGVTDHGALAGLADDDHAQYHNNARGDARYTPIAHASDTANPHTVTKAQVGLGNVTNDAQLKAADLDTDSTMAANSDTKVPSQAAVKYHVAAAVAAVINSAPGALDTLDELAAAFGNDANFAATMTTALSGKVPTSRAVSTSGLASGGGALSADRTIDVPIASQAEAEAGAINTKAMTPLRVAQAVAALGGGGGSPISNPDVGYIRGDGDDGTGDGSINAPFATFQAAVDAGFRVLDFGVDDIAAPFGGLNWSTAASLTLFIRGCGVGKTTLGPIAFNCSSGVQLTIHDLGRHSFKIPASGGTPAIACRDSATPGSQASQVNLFGVVVEGDIQLSGVDGDSFSAGGGGGAASIERGAIHFSGGIYAFGGAGGAGDAFNGGGNGGIGGSVVVLDSQAAILYVTGGAGGSDGGSGAGSAGSDGSVTLQRAVVTAMTPDAATALASCINGVFYANAYP